MKKILEQSKKISVAHLYTVVLLGFLVVTIYFTFRNSYTSRMGEISNNIGLEIYFMLFFLLIISFPIIVMFNLSSMSKKLSKLERLLQNKNKIN